MALLVEATCALGGGLLAASVVAGVDWLVVTALAMWAMLGYHEGWTVMSPIRRHVRTVAHSTAAALAGAALAVAVGVAGPTMLTATAAAVLTAGAVAVGGSALRRLQRGAVRTLVVGDPSGVSCLVSHWESSPSVDIVAACVLSPDGYGLADSGLDDDSGFDGPVLRSLRDIPAAVELLGVGAVILAPRSSVTSADLRRLSWSLEGMPVHLGIAGVLDAVGAHRLSPGLLGGRSVVEVHPSRRSRWLRAVKALADRLAGLVLLLLALPILTVLCVGVRIDSPGAAIFRQVRIGLNGRPFTMYKMRTMRVDAELLRLPLQRTAGNSVLFKMQEDPRTTRFGRLLRRSSLDELPQLLNVVRGDMSLIGPRPALPDEVATYDVEAHRRLSVKPGLTGLWQISGRSDLSWEQSLALDLHYVDNWRLTDDVLIFGRTLHAVLRAKGAY